MQFLPNTFRNGITKAVFYRIFSSLLTFIIAYFVTGNLTASVSVGFIDILIKIYAYYVFEKAWNSITGFRPRPAVVWLTGLSGSGKTTLARQLCGDLQQFGINTVLLDGDEIRKAVKHTGFDEDSRKKHNLNVGYMAALFEKQGNVVIVSLISPYSETRNEVRNMCGNFIEVYVCTPLEVCQQRDTKGLYKKALSGEIKDFTGISAPYQAPVFAELNIDTSKTECRTASQTIIQFLRKQSREKTLLQEQVS